MSYAARRAFRAADQYSGALLSDTRDHHQGRFGRPLGRLGREPSPEEIAEQMEMPLDNVQKALNIVKELRLRRSRPRGPFLEQRRCRVCNVGRCSSAEIKHALAQHAYLNRVREDFMSGVRSGVDGTPTLFINGLRHDGSYDRDNLLAAIADVVR